MTPRHVRALRGAAAAWIATIIAATSHTLAGGGAPSPVLIAVLGVLASPVAIALVGRRLSVWRVGTAVAVSQGLFHTAFAMTAGVDPTGLRGHVHDVQLVGGTSTAGVLPDGGMLVGHLIAAVATLVVLYHGERMLRACAPVSPITERMRMSIVFVTAARWPRTRSSISGSALAMRSRR